MHKKSILATAGILAFIFAFASCGGAAKEAATISSLRVAEQVPNLITPGVWDGQAFSLNSSIYDYLVEIDANTGQLSPSLATEWTTPDGKVWTIQLRQGVKFHDGSDFSSEDVKFTIERTQDPAIGHLKAQDFSVVESVDASNPQTIVITLKEVRPTFIYQMSDYNMAILSSEYDYIGKGETAPMGTGAFMIKSFMPKESAHLVRNPGFWHDGYPLVDELLIYFVPDIDSSVALLEAGKVDIVPQVTPLIKQRLENLSGFKVVSPYQEQRFIAMAADREPFDDNRVRLAMKYAMDPAILAKASQGELGVDVFYNETPIMDMLAQYREIPARGQDIAKAKQLLAEAGYPNGVAFELFYASDHPYSPALAQAVKELAAPAGFDVQLKGFPRDIYLSQYWMDGPMLITGWGGRVDPSVLLNLAFHSKGPWNESHINDAEVDTLIAGILSETDDAARQELYTRLQQRFFEAGTLLNVQVPYLVAMKEGVTDFRQPITMLPQYKYASIKASE
ncbi:MAG: ABC transporter substrate-binding protein [Clostridia bacterium]